VLDMLIRGPFSAVEVGLFDDNDNDEDTEDLCPWEIEGSCRQGVVSLPLLCSLFDTLVRRMFGAGG
jgi:hypothetical protein